MHNLNQFNPTSLLIICICNIHFNIIPLLTPWPLPKKFYIQTIVCSCFLHVSFLD